MAGFTKLFSDIVDSSIWDEDSDTCKVWVTLLALSDADGFVRGAVPWLAHKARVSIPKCQIALSKFESTDALSRTPDNEGRRIKTVDTGWILLNHHIFRERVVLSQDPRRVYQREWMRNKRLKKKGCQSVNSCQRESTPASASVSASEGDTGEVQNFPEIEIPSWEDVRFHADRIGLPEWRAQDWFNEMESVGWRDKGGREIFNWRAMMARVKGWWERDGRPVEPPVRKNGSRPNTPMDIKTVIQAKEKLAGDIRQQFCSDTAIDSIWSDESKRREFFTLKREVKKLNLQLSSMA